jgi:AraC-like DNA-binding protein/ligand-binding sensor protein
MIGNQQCGPLPDRRGEEALPSQLGSGGHLISRYDLQPAELREAFIPLGLEPKWRAPVQGNGARRAFEVILQSAMYQAFRSAYQGATGLSLILIPSPSENDGTFAREDFTPEFCRLLNRHPAARNACEKFTLEISERAAAEKRLCCARCSAGLLEIAIPLFDGDKHIATLMAGRVFVGQRCPDDRTRVRGLLGQCGQQEFKRIAKARRTVPVVGDQRIQAACRLVEFFAKAIEERLPGWLLSNTEHVPLAVSKAKEYVTQHISERLPEPEVARHAGVSVQHFCKLFKATTGLTFADFVARQRTEQAKSLLQQNSLRIAEIAFECGFGSIPTFNRTFKRLAGSSPTQYKSSRLDCP